MKTVDAKGKLCPLPLIMTKKALLELDKNESLDIILDNETSLSNVCHFLSEYKMQYSIEKRGDEMTIHVNKTGIITTDAKAEDFCQMPQNNLSNYVILIKSKFLGEGAEELGEILIKGLINTLPDIDRKPEKIIFLNSGILLSLIDSPVLESLKKLESYGVKILVCGTCLDYYKKKDQIGVGEISNMYDIIDSLTKCSKVIVP